jgi:hypothetical protein
LAYLANGAFDGAKDGDYCWYAGFWAGFIVLMKIGWLVLQSFLSGELVDMHDYEKMSKSNDCAIRFSTTPKLVLQDQRRGCSDICTHIELTSHINVFLYAWKGAACSRAQTSLTSISLYPKYEATEGRVE